MFNLLGGYEFAFVGLIEVKRDQGGEIEVDYPQERYLKRHSSHLHTYGVGGFCKFRIPTNWPYRGVYIITVEDTPYYVGKCEHLSKRYNSGYGQISPRNCYRGGQSTNCRINQLILDETQNNREIGLWFYQTDHHSAIESRLIQQLNTRKQWNRSR